MAGNSLEQDIISLYSGNISSFYSINQIATLLGKKYPYINKKVTVLIKKDIFKRTVIGRSHLCSLNLKNDETKYLLILNEINKKKAAVKNNSTLTKSFDYAEKAAKLTNIQTIIKKNNTIFFIVGKKEDKEHAEQIIVKQILRNQEVRILTKDELKELLTDDKEIHENHIIIYGFEKYYEIISEIEDELRIRHSKLLP